jgi:outer membrane protein OmpA-like peptidoglycan-associated protein
VNEAVAASSDRTAEMVILPNELQSVAPQPEVDAPAVVVAPKIAAIDQSKLLSISFVAQQTDISQTDRERVMALSDRIKIDPSKRLKIVSYATQIEDRTGSARRISLQRAIGIRGIMVKNGIDGSRINVQAMGDALDAGVSTDRADIQIISD